MRNECNVKLWVWDNCAANRLCMSSAQRVNAAQTEACWWKIFWDCTVLHELGQSCLLRTDKHLVCLQNRTVWIQIRVDQRGCWANLISHSNLIFCSYSTMQHLNFLMRLTLCNPPWNHGYPDNKVFWVLPAHFFFSVDACVIYLDCRVLQLKLMACFHNAPASKHRE